MRSTTRSRLAVCSLFAGRSVPAVFPARWPGRVIDARCSDPSLAARLPAIFAAHAEEIKRLVWVAWARKRSRRQRKTLVQVLQAVLQRLQSLLPVQLLLF